MTYSKRPWQEGACYHITARGNRKEYIFKENNDFKYYLSLVEEALEYYKEYNYKIICYCLMNNHVHLMIKTDTKPVGTLIARIHSIYTRYFNKKYEFVGHLFQGRYHSEIIKDDKQFLETTRYIHLNPVRASIVAKPQMYKWSSYNMLIGNKEERIIDSEMIHRYFIYEKKHQLYKNFINSAPGV